MGASLVKEGHNIATSVSRRCCMLASVEIVGRKRASSRIYKDPLPTPTWPSHRASQGAQTSTLLNAIRPQSRS